LHISTETPVYLMSTSAEFEPYDMIIFYEEDGREVGRIDWADGTFKFHGHVDKSACLFLEYFWSAYVIPVCSEKRKSYD